MEAKDLKKNLSIRNMILILFISSILVAVGGIGIIIFTNWFGSVQEMTEFMAVHMNEHIYNQVHSFLHTPEHMNDMYRHVIMNHIIDLSVPQERNRFFAGSLNAHSEEVYSFVYSNENGDYYGARRSESGGTEVIIADAETKDEAWYYSVNEDLTVKEVARRVKRNDPRKQEWYITGKNADGPVFASVYTHSLMKELCLPYVQPVRREDGSFEGVLSVHVLLSSIDTFLDESAMEYKGYAVLLDKDTMGIIAKSEGTDFDVVNVYEKYISGGKPNFQYLIDSGNLFVNVKELPIGKSTWVVLTAIPETHLMGPLAKNVRITLLLAAAALLLAIVVSSLISDRFLKSISHLLHVSESFAKGDLTKRVSIIRNDEIGRISQSFNRVADTMQNIIDNLEATVKVRTKELNEIAESMKENKERLQLILDSTEEGIYGNDLEGNCTFCNVSCLRILGYRSQEDLLGKNMHLLIHYKKPDGTPYPIEECKIMASMKYKAGTYSDDEVFIRADGTPVKVEYRSHPQIKDGKVVGAVITFSDITQRKEKEAEIEYLIKHDTLTGLYNRNSLQEHLKALDHKDNLPLSVIFADINGLKMTNDIFGHTAGDALIRKSSEILIHSCRKRDVIARVGGDEFIILLPNTRYENAQTVVGRIRERFKTARIEAVKCSISLGVETKTDEKQSVEEIIASAENALYKDKSMNRKETGTVMINTIIETLHAKSKKEKEHSENVSRLCEKVGEALELSDTEIGRLSRAGYLHDIGKITMDGSILSDWKAKSEDSEEMTRHSIVGYRILNLFDETVDLAEAVYYHHERWDGKGYPEGIKGFAIPLISRIISIVETYDRIANRNKGNAEGREKALRVIREGRGTRFDPEIAEVFLKIVS